MQQPLIRVALAGNPNAGKSTLFNALTGCRQHTGNWAGKTVTGASAPLRHRFGPGLELTDLPGTYSLQGHSPEQAEAARALLHGDFDAVAAVLDGSAPERGLPLILQLKRQLAGRVPLGIIVTQLDEAARLQLTPDLERLSLELGLPVLGVSARRRLDRGKAAEFIRHLAAQSAGMQSADDTDRQGAGAAPDRPAAEETADDLRTARALARRIRPAAAPPKLRLCGWGAYPLLALGLAVIFWLSLAGAAAPSDWLGNAANLLEARLQLWCSHWPPMLRELLCSGVFRTAAWVIAVMAPPLLIFFPLLALAEDAGLLPRLAFGLDRCFRGCAACGKQALTVCLGFGCNAVGVSGCAIISSPRERLIAILTNSLAPCNGRWPTLMLTAGLLAATLGGRVLILVLVTLGSLGLTLALSKLLSCTLLKGVPSFLALELPPLRPPRVGAALRQAVVERAGAVLLRAVALAAPAGAGLWLLANLHMGGGSLLSVCAAALDPLGRLVGVDGAVLLALLLSLPANEIILPVLLMIYQGGSALLPADPAQLGNLLSQAGWTPLTAVCFLLLLILRGPCAPTLMTIRRETGSLRWTLTAWLLPLCVSLALCAVLNGVAALLL